MEIIAKKSSYYYTKNGNALQESLIPVMMEPAGIRRTGGGEQKRTSEKGDSAAEEGKEGLP